jgi:hypothetical protein
MGLDVFLGSADQVGVERPAQAAVGRDKHQENLFDGPHGKQRVISLLGAGGYTLEERHHLIGVRARIEDCILGAPQTSRRNHLHGAGNLLCVFHRPNATPNIK